MNDPIPELRRFCLLATDDALSKEIRQELIHLKTKVDSCGVEGEKDRWGKVYEESLDIAQNAATSLNNCLPPTGNPSSDSTDSMNRRQEAIRKVQHYRQDFSQTDREAFSYISNNRLRKQREGEIQKAIERLQSTIDPQISEDGNSITVSLPQSQKTEIQEKVSYLFHQWQEQVVDGLIARVYKNRSQVIEYLDDSLILLNLERPPLPVKKVQTQTNGPELPETKSGSTLGYGSALWRTFRSSYGIVMMISMILVPVLMLFGNVREYGGIRYLILALMMPILFLVASILAKKKIQEEKEKLEKKLEEELLRDIAKGLSSSADTARAHIQDVLQKIQKSHEMAMTDWRFALEKTLDTMARTPTVPSVSPEVADAASGRKKAIATQLVQRTIPALIRRISELREG